MQHKCAAPRGEQDSSRSSKKVKIVYGSVERTIEKKGKRSTREKERECGRCRGELELLGRRGGSVFFHCHFLLLLTPKISRAVSMCLMWGACAQRPLTHAHTHMCSVSYLSVDSKDARVCLASSVWRFYCCCASPVLWIVVLWAFGMWLRVMRIWQINSWFAPLSPIPFSAPSWR